jgi:hypothetical protein
MQLHQCPDLTVLGASPPVKVQVKCSTLEHSGNHWIFRLTGQLALLRYHFPITRKATSAMFRFDGIGLAPFRFKRSHRRACADATQNVASLRRID